ncbi:universal stress protein [Lyngbya confervoides]|uniref:Universal stress protein n=1 Tax=Lyngbya confervoides BDU141951 TaxID=1574623 RepID=A0ABD4T7S5_9CYAN|nr:universal stress protein [Lyngbya confervoides]MCM1984523.1 universal stress protein [Lyngbya confervoides BDU141951]
MVFETVLVALASSDLADDLTQQVIASVQSLQLEPDSKVVLTHVVCVGEKDVDLEMDRPHSEPHVDGIRRVERILATLQSQFPCASEIEVVSGDPVEEIVRLAHIHRASLVVLGNRGLRGVNRILQGSVSSQVVSEAPCTVMVVKPHSLESIES